MHRGTAGIEFSNQMKEHDPMDRVASKRREGDMMMLLPLMIPGVVMLYSGQHLSPVNRALRKARRDAGLNWLF